MVFFKKIKTNFQRSERNLTIGKLLEKILFRIMAKVLFIWISIYEVIDTLAYVFKVKKLYFCRS